MMQRLRCLRVIACAVGLATPFAAIATEFTMKNDNYGVDPATVVGDFVAGEKAAAWLTSTVDGKVVAVQIGWASAGGTSPELGAGIDICRAGTFPNPGPLVQRVLAPQLTDPAVNEYRNLDMDNPIPINVPVLAGERIVVALEYAFPTNVAGGSASIIRDAASVNGNNAIRVHLGGGSFAWFEARSLLVNGDFVIRMVVNTTVPDIPTVSTPSNGALDVPVNAVLDWPDTAVAREYDVYLWRTADSPPGSPTSASLTVSQYDPPGDLDASTQYSWRLVARNNNGSTNSPTFNFTTAGAASVANWSMYE